MRPAGSHKYDRLGDKTIYPTIPNLDAAEALTELKHDLARLTLDISDVEIDDLPLCFKRHTMGVP